MTHDTEHTPGPWYVKKKGPHWNNTDLVRIAVCYGNDDEHICDTVYEEKDAHLISAAPDLLNALEFIRDNTDETLTNNVAVHAIAKAKGEKTMSKSQKQHNLTSKTFEQSGRGCPPEYFDMPKEVFRNGRWYSIEEWNKRIPKNRR